jgi:hypothetical protein
MNHVDIFCGHLFLYDHLVYFTAIWYSFSFGIFFPFWHVYTKENLATLMLTLIGQLSVCFGNFIFAIADSWLGPML